ncbi:MAG: serine--tRNA ligase [Rhodobacteraceae bacterium]|jgi:seryl-tRNA synthetase|nr:serine--tRNA ligase [Paracoccaceae bacterium]NCV67349.1 serine--tRNA ligase [Paracoccaceae bacterium]NCW61671.1 serine--tRNA ligase [Paracoccaceae bacterium]NCW65479.1 serine--tRNA ligase [Paracoccaceae bacterium]NCX07753.1 serine--tRNA ligase [Paracoccaceae bacterium]
MHDIRAIRENPAAFDAALARRGVSDASSGLLKIDGDRRAAILAAETAQAEQNKASKEVGAAKGRGDEAEFERLRALVAEKKAEVAEMNALAKELDEALTDALARLPNLPHDDIPDGADEADNVEIHRWGTPPEIADAKEHYDLPAARGLDFETAAKLSGSRFVVLRGAMARLHRALAQFMLDTHVNEHGLTETMTPVLVRDEAMFGTGQLPKFTEDSYQTTNGWWLIPTSEVTLTNTVAGDVLEEADLPIRMTAHTQCFRSEAGSAGRDTAGMLRQHQFEKVEMVSITHPDHSRAELDRMTGCAQAILEKLGLPYRTVVLCTGDMGAGARRTHDIEVWLPGQNTYREISSVSVCGDFQARRMNARFKPEAGGKPEFVHTLNGSGLAVGRCLIAVLENGQQPDGSVALPAVLHGYLGGKTQITAEGELA